MKKIFLSFLYCSFVVLTNGQKWAYSLDDVPDSIKNKATVIVHLEEINFEVESLNKANLSIHKIFTVVNEEGEKALFFNQYSTKQASLKDVEIKVYDKNGRQTGKYKKKDMRTIAIGEGLVEDGFMTYYPIEVYNYPVTIEVSYEIAFKSTLSIPDYRFIDEREGIVSSSYTATVPLDINLKYKAENTSLKPVITENSKNKIYKWEVKSLVPVEYEEGAVSSLSRYPYIKIITEKFSHYGYEGDFYSWKSFGSWIKELYDGLDVLPQERQQYFVNMVKDAPDEREKVRRIYKYLQNNFRYVSIQLGIGGLKPFSAEFTDSKKYGDCKALSNYMKAALKSVGIPSYVAIINAEYDELPVDPDFPSNGFNHVILCVPGKQDSIWLECTSSSVDFGELGTFTENRNALLITDEGGVLVPTPRSHSAENVISTFTAVDLADDMSAITETDFKTRGEYREIMNDILKEKRDDQKEAVVLYFGFKQPDDFVLTKDAADEYHTKLKMAIRKVPEFNAGDKWFINPRMYKLWSSKLPKSSDRKLDFYFRYPFEKYDTTAFRLTPDLIPDVLPRGKELDNKYVYYKSSYWYNEGERTLYSASSLILKKHVIPAADYGSVKKFFEDVAQDDSEKIVVRKNETKKKAF